MILYQESISTPIGELLIVTNQQGELCALDWLDHRERFEKLLLRYFGQMPELASSTVHSVNLRSYFEGDLGKCQNSTLHWSGTHFQQSVWKELCKIPVAETISYGELARRIQNPKAVRAVGLANGANPLSIVVPCHRVIGANGSLTGYGGGLQRKEWLLAHEARFSTRQK